MLLSKIHTTWAIYGALRFFTGLASLPLDTHTPAVTSATTPTHADS